MKKIVYLAGVGYSKKTKQCNFGPFKGGFESLRPYTIERVILIHGGESKSVTKDIESQYSYVKGKIGEKIVDIFDFTKTFEKVMQIYKENKDERFEFIVNVTGGTKMMSLGLYTGAMIIGAKIQYVIENRNQDLPLNNENRVVDIHIPQISVFDMHPFRKLILIAMREEEKDLQQTELRKLINEKYLKEHRRELGEKFKTKKLTPQLMSHHCQYLEKEKLIRRYHDEENNKAHILQLTQMGSSIAAFLSL